MRARLMPRTELCPQCRKPLEVRRSRFGLVRVCAECLGGTTTLSVLKRVAPREFINHLWQAAQRSGLPSEKPCPSCTQPLLELRPPDIVIEPRIDVCIRCYIVWFEHAALSRLQLALPPDRFEQVVARAEAAAVAAAHRTDRASLDAALGLIAQGILGALEEGP
jgi:Zn-finger nucleic acid-binding protein